MLLVDAVKWTLNSTLYTATSAAGRRGEVDIEQYTYTLLLVLLVDVVKWTLKCCQCRGEALSTIVHT